MKKKKTDFGFKRFVNGEKFHPRNDRKKKRKGINVWPSMIDGTYVFKEHGKLKV
ncbi:MAG: hypothetical protein ACLFQE_05430 [Thermotogota bacterium]